VLLNMPSPRRAGNLRILNLNHHHNLNRITVVIEMKWQLLVMLRSMTQRLAFGA
jgi:hypothetical protein